MPQSIPVLTPPLLLGNGLIGVLRLCITRRHRYGAAVCSRGVLVHCPSRLGAAVAVQAAEIPCSDGVSTKSALEYAKAVHHFDVVMSHSFNCRLSSLYKLRTKDHRSSGVKRPAIALTVSSMSVTQE